MKPTLLNVDAPYPDQPLTLLINQEDRENFLIPEEVHLNKTILESGKVGTFKGKPQIGLYNVQLVEIIAGQEATAAIFASADTNVAAGQAAPDEATQRVKDSSEQEDNASISNSELPSSNQAHGLSL
jgi:hypothetical protein